MKVISKTQQDAMTSFSENLEVTGRSLWQDARRRFIRNKAAIASLIILGGIALFVLFAPLLSEYSYDHTDWGMMSHPPHFESGHFLGTDSNGRDIFVRIAVGGEYLY